MKEHYAEIIDDSKEVVARVSADISLLGNNEKEEVVEEHWLTKFIKKIFKR